jgi:hypothetical protein
MIRPASTLDCQVREIGVFCETAVATSVGLVRSATTGTPSTSALCQAQDPQRPASQTNIDTAWSAAATVAANYQRQIILPATIGAGVIWTFGPYELWAKNGATTQLMLWNFGAGTGAALRLYIVIDE